MLSDGLVRMFHTSQEGSNGCGVATVGEGGRNLLQWALYVTLAARGGYCGGCIPPRVEHDNVCSLETPTSHPPPVDMSKPEIEVVSSPVVSARRIPAGKGQGYNMTTMVSSLGV